MLQGTPRDQIANEAYIGDGTVSSIIKESTKKDPQIDLLREVAVNLQKNVLNIESFAPFSMLDSNQTLDRISFHWTIP